MTLIWIHTIPLCEEQTIEVVFIFLSNMKTWKAPQKSYELKYVPVCLLIPLYYSTAPAEMDLLDLF